MIWYLHWLDLRVRLLLATGAALGGLVWIPLRLGKDLSAYAATGKLPPSLDSYGSVLNSMGLESFYVWATFSNYMLTILMFCPLVVATVHRAPNVYLALSLPVSRLRLILTRFAANWVGVVAIYAILTATAVALVANQGLPRPWEPMLITSAMALIAVAPGLAVAEFFNVICDTPLRASVAMILGFIPWVAFTFWMSRAAKGVAVLAESPAVLLAVAIAGSAAALGVAATAMRDKEY